MEVCVKFKSFKTISHCRQLTAAHAACANYICKDNQRRKRMPGLQMSFSPNDNSGEDSERELWKRSYFSAKYESCMSRQKHIWHGNDTVPDPFVFLGLHWTEKALERYVLRLTFEARFGYGK